MSANAPIILVVEDDAIVRMLIVDVLEELEFKVLEGSILNTCFTTCTKAGILDPPPISSIL